LYDIQGRYAEAIAIYRQLLEKNQRNLIALNNLAWFVALTEGKGAEALQLMEKAFDLVGPTPELLDTRGVINLKIGQKKKAIQDLEQAVSISESPSRYFHLAQAHLLAGNRNAAIVAFQKATKGGLTEDSLHPLERGEFQRVHAKLKTN
jgi:tetratricopeptide (TPR) repeat protein